MNVAMYLLNRTERRDRSISYYPGVVPVWIVSSGKLKLHENAQNDLKYHWKLPHLWNPVWVSQFLVGNWILCVSVSEWVCRIGNRDSAAGQWLLSREMEREKSLGIQSAAFNAFMNFSVASFFLLRDLCPVVLYVALDISIDAIN